MLVTRHHACLLFPQTDVTPLLWEPVALKGSPPSARSGTTCCVVPGASSVPEVFLYGGFGDGTEREEMFLLKPGV